MSGLHEKLKSIYIIIVASLLLFMIIAIVHAKAGNETITEHNAYDSYTLQAMTWRDGKIALDHNYKWLELAVLNDEYFSTHSMNDPLAYKDFFYDENNNFIEYEENEYYVSFPPFPSVPMLLASFIFRENTPSNLIGILYGIGAFIFAILLCRRFNLNFIYSICGGFLLTLCSSAFFLMCSGMEGSVWYIAQLLSLFLTTAAFYFIHGNKSIEHFTAFILLGFAVGCRPFQLLYYFYFAYVVLKKNNYKFVKTIKYYIPAACIGLCYIVYNYVRFGNIMEFGHNYLPEMMLAPDGQFSLRYIIANYDDMFLSLPQIIDGRLEFSLFSFACWICNVIFIILVLGLIIKLIKNISSKHNKTTAEEKKSYNIEIIILFLLIIAHFILTMMHKTLGMVQFGSRYTVDILPAALVLLIYLIKPVLNSKDNSFGKYLFNYLGFVCIAGSAVLNITASYKYMMFTGGNADKPFAYELRHVNIFAALIIISLVLFILFLLLKKSSLKTVLIISDEIENS